MEGGSKKRKLGYDSKEYEDEVDEEQMQQFYTLIRTFREARDHMMHRADVSNNTANNEKDKQRKLLEEDRTCAVWKPKFKMEDFMEEAQLINPAVKLAESSQIKEVTEKEDIHGESLDLKLSL